MVPDYGKIVMSPKDYVAPIKFLLWQRNLDPGIATLGVERLQRLQRLLHIAEITTFPGVGPQQSFDIRQRQQRIAFNAVAADLEFQARTTGDIIDDNRAGLRQQQAAQGCNRVGCMHGIRRLHKRPAIAG